MNATVLLTSVDINIPGYRILRPIGEGGMASVFLAVQESLDREVALKVMSPALAANPEFASRFLTEGKITAKLQHPNLVTVHDIGSHGSVYYLAAEYIPGGTLKERITQDMKDAMRSGDKERLGNIRMLQAAIKQREVDERITLDDGQVLAVVEKMIKQRKEAIAQFEAGGRADLAAKEQSEIALLQAYMPEQLSSAEVEALVAAAIAETAASTIKDMGKVMALVKTRAAGRADMAAVSALIKAKLGAG